MCVGNQKRVPHISPSFGEMWEIYQLPPDILRTWKPANSQNVYTAIRLKGRKLPASHWVSVCEVKMNSGLTDLLN
jgi:hypothetical protein